MMRSDTWNRLNDIYWKAIEKGAERQFMLNLIHNFRPTKGETESQMNTLYQDIVTGLEENNFPKDQAERIALHFFQTFEPKR